MNDIAKGYLDALNVDALSNEPADMALRKPDEKKQQYLVSPESMDAPGAETPGMTRKPEEEPPGLTTRSVMHPQHGTAAGAVIEQGQRGADIMKGALGKTFEASAHFWNVLDKAADEISKATGKDKGGLFRQFSDMSQHWADNYQGKVRFKDFATNVTTGMLGSGPGIAMFGMGPIWAGLEGYTEDGIAGAIKGVGRRWMAGKVFGALHEDPNIVSRMATGSAFFTAESAVQGETDPGKLAEAATIGAFFTAKGKDPNYFKPTPGQKVDASDFAKELDRAVNMGEMSPESAMVAKAFVAQHMGGEVDATTSIKVLSEIKLASDEVLVSEGIRPGTPAVITGTAATITDGENLKTMIELYRGNDPTTVIEELFHRDFHRMSLEERQELRVEYDKEEALQERPRSMDEWYAQSKMQEFFATAGQAAGPMGKMQQWFKTAVDKVRSIPGNEVAKGLYEGAKKKWREGTSSLAAAQPELSSQVSQTGKINVARPDGPWQGESFQVKHVQAEVQVNNKTREVRTYEVSIQPEILAKMKDREAPIPLQSFEVARYANSNPERVADWEQMYKDAEPIKVWGDAKKAIAKNGKIMNIPIVALTKGCQRSRVTVERVENGVLPNETRVEACYGGECWANRQFNSIFGNFENMDVKDLKLARPEDIDGWLSKPATKKFLETGPFIRQGQQGDDSHLFATGLAKAWLEGIEKHGIDRKTVFISAGYAPVTREQYAELKPFADKFELHFSLSGWFDKNEIMLRLGEFKEARDAGLPAIVRVITNADEISGLKMVNQEFLDAKLKELGVKQSEVLETPFHDDTLKKKKNVQDRSEPTGSYKHVCCETGKCISCPWQCMTKEAGGSIATSETIVNPPHPFEQTSHQVVPYEDFKAAKKRKDLDRYVSKFKELNTEDITDGAPFPPAEVTTDDGYTFKRQKDGSYTDGDMTFKDFDELANAGFATLPEAQGMEKSLAEFNKPTGPEEAAAVFYDKHALKYDGEMDLSAINKPPLYQFTPHDGPLRGRTFTVDQATPEAIQAKMDTMPPRQDWVDARRTNIVIDGKDITDTLSNKIDTELIGRMVPENADYDSILKNLDDMHKRVVDEIERVGDDPIMYRMMDMAASLDQLIQAAKDGKLEIKPPTVQQSYQAKMIKTPEFKQWYEGSPLVDKKDRPLVLYHGTTKSFSDFKVGPVGGKGRSEAFTTGVWLTNKPDYADQFAKGLTLSQEQGRAAQGEGYPEGGNIRPVFAAIKNPQYQVLEFGRSKGDELAWRKSAEAAGYDSIVFFPSLDSAKFDMDKAQKFLEKEGMLEKGEKLEGLDVAQSLIYEGNLLQEAVDAGAVKVDPTQTGVEVLVFDPKQIRSAFDDTQRSAQVKTTGSTMVTPDDLKPLEEVSKYASLNINVTKLDGTDLSDVRNMLDQLAAAHEDDLTVAQGGPVTHEQMAAEGKQMAERLAQQTNTPVKTLLKKWDKDAKKMYARATAARMVHLQAARELMAQAKKARGMDATDRDLATYRIALSNFYEIHRAVTGITATAGRTLSAFNVRVGSDALGSDRLLTRQFDDLLNSPGGDRKLVHEMADKLTQLEDLALPPDELVEMVDRIATGFAKATTSDMLLEAWINGLLSGPQTHAANMLSNSLVMMTQVPERWLAAQFGRLHDGDKVVLGEARAMTYGMFKGISDGFRGAWLAYKKGESSDIMGKVEQQHRAITATNMGLNEDSWMGRGVDLLAEHVIRQPGKLLMTEDEFFKTVGYRMELGAQAYRMAMAEGLEGRAFSDRVTELMLNPTDEIKLASQDSARYMTFTNDLGSTGKSIMSVANSHKGIKLIIPFIRTPTNVFKYAFARTPVAPLLMKSWRDDFKAGGPRRDMAMARVALGTMVMGMAGALAASGQMTGGGPVDPGERRIWMQQYKPYSVRVGNKWISYQRLEPIGSLLGMAADAWEVQQNSETVQDMNDGLVVAAAILSRQVTSKTFTRGISDFLQAINDPTRYGDRYFLRGAGTVVPNLVPQLNQDPYFREAQGVIDTIKARTPWADSLKPRLDVWGEPIKKEGSLGPDWISPVWIGSDKSTPIDRVMNDNHIGMRNLSRTISVGGVSMKLDGDQWERYQKLVGNELKLPYEGGKPKGLKDQLNFQVQRKSFDRLSDGPDGGKAAFINNMVGKYREAARAKLREEYPELDAAAKETNVLRRINMLKQ